MVTYNPKNMFKKPPEAATALPRKFQAWSLLDTTYFPVKIALDS